MQEKVENKRGLLTRKIKWRTQTLFFSLILNAFFLGIFFYFFVRESPIPVTFSFRPATPIKEHYISHAEIFNALEKLEREKTFSLLKENRHVEEGITIRDLALTHLVAKERFDIERALGRKPSQKGTLKIEEKSFPLFDISDEDFKLVNRFASIEKFPYSTEKLFQLVKEEGESVDPSLLQMFFDTEEFLSVQKLFSLIPLQKKILAALVCEGTFATLHDFLKEQKEAFDISDKKRRSFLLKYLNEGSKTAALLILHTDQTFALKYFDDKMLLTMLERLPEKNEKGSLFAATLLNSSRSEMLKKGAELYLSQDKEIAKKFFNRPSIGQLRPVYREAPPKAPSPSQHIVQPGESLWSIARKYQVPLDTLMQLNHLTTTTIQTGKIIRLP